MKTGTKAPALLLATLTLAATAGCVTPGHRTVIGGAGGAIIGGGVGAAAGGGKGAAIGAGVGAAAGAALGNYLDRRARELEQVAETRKTEHGLLVELDNDLLFATDSATLAPPALEQVAKLGDILARYPEDRIRLEGHTDSTGPAPYNDSLSQRRADAVAQVLRARGVSATQLQVLGLGEARPAASNATLAGRAENRRVEMHIQVPPQTRQG